MKVSVIIPTHNSERTLERALQSVRNQTAKCEIEIFICDDHSDDQKWIKAMAEKYNCDFFDSVINHGGPSWGRNVGITFADGDYLAFIDQDDYWLPDKLRYQLGLIKKHDQDLIYSSHVGSGSPYSEQPDTDIHERLLHLDFSEGAMYPSSILVRNEKVPLSRDYITDYDWSVSLTSGRRCMRSNPMVGRGEIGLSASLRYKIHDNNVKLGVITDYETRRRVYGTLARCYYAIGDGRMARECLYNAGASIKNYAYFLTSYFPPVRKFIVKQFGVYGT